jgi:hypothetical protein
MGILITTFYAMKISTSSLKLFFKVFLKPSLLNFNIKFFIMYIFFIKNIQCLILVYDVIKLFYRSKTMNCSAKNKNIIVIKIYFAEQNISVFVHYFYFSIIKNKKKFAACQNGIVVLPYHNYFLGYGNFLNAAPKVEDQS